MDFDWKSIVKTVAPVLGTALGGPMGGLAARTIAGAVLGDETASEDQIAQAVAAASPEQLLALKKADQDFQLRMKELEVDIVRIDQQDRGSARDREALFSGMVSEAGLKIDNDALDWLSDNLDAGRGVVRSEMEKLILSADASGRIDLSLVQSVVSGEGDAAADALVQLACSGETAALGPGHFKQCQWTIRWLQWVS